MSKRENTHFQCIGIEQRNTTKAKQTNKKDCLMLLFSPSNSNLDLTQFILKKIWQLENMWNSPTPHPATSAANTSFMLRDL